MPNDLTAEEIEMLLQLGQRMCDDMIRCAAFADDAADWGVIDYRVTDEVTDSWIAIAQEYSDALHILEAGRVLLFSHHGYMRLCSHTAL